MDRLETAKQLISLNGISAARVIIENNMTRALSDGFTQNYNYWKGVKQEFETVVENMSKVK